MKANLYYNSRGSLYELENQAIIARDPGYISSDDHEHVKVLVVAGAHDLNRNTIALVNRE